MKPQPHYSNQFPVAKNPEPTKKSATGTYQLLYQGAEICKGNSGLVYGMKANLIKAKTHNRKLFTIKPI